MRWINCGVTITGLDNFAVVFPIVRIPIKQSAFNGKKDDFFRGLPVTRTLGFQLLSPPCSRDSLSNPSHFTFETPFFCCELMNVFGVKEKMGKLIEMNYLELVWRWSKSNKSLEDAYKHNIFFKTNMIIWVSWCLDMICSNKKSTILIRIHVSTRICFLVT